MRCRPRCATTTGAQPTNAPLPSRRPAACAARSKLTLCCLDRYQLYLDDLRTTCASGHGPDMAKSLSPRISISLDLPHPTLVANLLPSFPHLVSRRAMHGGDGSGEAGAELERRGLSIGALLLLYTVLLFTVVASAPMKGLAVFAHNLGCISAAPRLHRSCISAASPLHLGFTSDASRPHLAAPRPHFGCISAAPRLHLGCISASPRLHLGRRPRRRCAHRPHRRLAVADAAGRARALPHMIPNLSCVTPNLRHKPSWRSASRNPQS